MLEIHHFGREPSNFVCSQREKLTKFDHNTYFHHYSLKQKYWDYTWSFEGAGKCVIISVCRFLGSVTLPLMEKFSQCEVCSHSSMLNNTAVTSPQRKSAEFRSVHGCDLTTEKARGVEVCTHVSQHTVHGCDLTTDWGSLLNRGLCCPLGTACTRSWCERWGPGHPVARLSPQDSACAQNS